MTSPETQEKRSARYPVVIEQPLALYMMENYDVLDRLKQVVASTRTFATNTLALDPQVSTIRTVIANQIDPDGNPQSYDYAYIGVFFHNVTRSELEQYCAKITDEFNKNRKALFTHPEGLDLPAPEAFVPTTEWIRSQQEELGAMAEKTRGWFNKDGSLNREATREAEEAVAEAVSKDTKTKLNLPKSSLSSSTSPESISQEELDDFDEMDFL